MSAFTGYVCGLCGEEFTSNCGPGDIRCTTCEAQLCPHCGTWFSGLGEMSAAEPAADGPQPDAGGTNGAGAGDEVPEAAEAVSARPGPDIPWYALGLEGADPEAEIADLRRRIHHAGAALAGDNEGVRLWMLDCGNLVAKHRDHARRAEEKTAAIGNILRNFLAEYGDSTLPAFKVALDLDGDNAARLLSDDGGAKVIKMFERMYQGDIPKAKNAFVDWARSLEKILRAGDREPAPSAEPDAGERAGAEAAQDACDAEQFGDGPPSMFDGRCRCLVCGRCGHHTGNAHQGHYWKWCRVTGSLRDFHFCCSDPAYGCELEARGAAAGSPS